MTAWWSVHITQQLRTRRRSRRWNLRLSRGGDYENEQYIIRTSYLRIIKAVPIAVCLRELTGNWAFGWLLKEKNQKNPVHNNYSSDEGAGERREQNARVSYSALHKRELWDHFPLSVIMPFSVELSEVTIFSSIWLFNLKVYKYSYCTRVE